MSRSDRLPLSWACLLRRRGGDDVRECQAYGPLDHKRARDDHARGSVSIYRYLCTVATW